MARTLSYEEARRVYDRIGAFQDSQAFYEDATTSELVAHGAFEKASGVFEFGCGTGRFAGMLLAERLGPSARYRGVDLSPTMVGLARERLRRFGPRAEVALSEGGPPVDEPDASCDRWVSNFVFDLLSDSDIDAVLGQAHRMLAPGGLLCLASLSFGEAWYARGVGHAWQFVHGLSPELVGGCRPVDLAVRLRPERWKIVHRRSLASFLVPSDAIVAMRS